MSVQPIGPTLSTRRVPRRPTWSSVVGMPPADEVDEPVVKNRRFQETKRQQVTCHGAKKMAFPAEAFGMANLIISIATKAAVLPENVEAKTLPSGKTNWLLSAENDHFTELYSSPYLNP